jgi:hypothetical protein
MAAKQCMQALTIDLTSQSGSLLFAAAAAATAASLAAFIGSVAGSFGDVPL